MTPATTPTTGVTSTSFRVWLATFLPSVAAAVAAFVQNTGGSKTSVLGAAGIVSALVSTVVKLLHDKGIHIATITTAGSDIAAQLPQLRTDISKTVEFIEGEVPGVKAVISDLGQRVNTLESKVPDLASIESVVRSVLADILKTQTQQVQA